MPCRVTGPALPQECNAHARVWPRRGRRVDGPGLVQLGQGGNGLRSPRRLRAQPPDSARVGANAGPSSGLARAHGPKRKRPAERRAEPKAQHEAPAAVGALWRAQARAMPRAARACGTLRTQQRHLGWLCMRYSSQRSCEIVTLSRLLCNSTVGMESGRVDLVMLQSASSEPAWSWPAATCSAMPVRRVAGRVRALRMHRWRRALRGPARLAGARSMRRSSYHLVAKS